jgi:hypothetical protein
MGSAARASYIACCGRTSADTRPLDDQSEARLLAFCDCVATEVGSRLSPQDIAAIGLEQGNQELTAKLEAIFALCRLQYP